MSKKTGIYSVIRDGVRYEAMQVGKPSWKAVAEWSGGEIIAGFGGRYLYLHFWLTIGGNVKAGEGAWITKDPRGSLEFHTKPEFRAAFRPC